MNQFGQKQQKTFNKFPTVNRPLSFTGVYYVHPELLDFGPSDKVVILFDASLLNF